MINVEHLRVGLATRVLQVASQTFTYLKFDGRSGVMYVNDGDKEARFPNDVALAFNLMGSSQGYVCWKGGQIVGQHSQSFFEPLVPIASMEDRGPYADKDGWQEQHNLFFADLKTSTQYILRLVSKSGLKAANNLIRTMFEQSAVHDITKQIPLIRIDVEPYDRQHYRPVFNIIEWR